MANDFDSDAMLAFVGQLTKQFQDLQKVLVDIGNQSGTGMKKAGDEVERFGSSVKKHAGTSIKEMNLGLKDMATSLLGPVGIAVGIYKVGQALETFAVGQIRLQNFARDAGYTSQSIQRLQFAGEHMGYTIAETNDIIKNFGSSVTSLHLDKQASDLWRNLDRIRDGGHQVALTIDRMKREGKDNAEIMQYGADLIVKQLRRQTDEGNRAAEALSRALGIPISMAEQLAGAKKKVKDDDILVLTPEQRAKQEQYNDAWLGMTRQFWKDLGSIQQWGIETLVDANKKNTEAGGGFNRMRQEDIKASREVWERLFPGADKNLDEDIRDPKTGLPLGGAGRGLPPMTQPVRDAVETQKESKGLLEDIRNILQTMLIGDAGADIGGASGTTFRPGVRSGGAGGGGSTGGSAGAMAGSVRGHAVDPYGGLSGQKIFEPVTATSLGGGVGGTSRAFGPGGHEGVDIMATVGSPTHSPMDGTVAHVGRDSYGQQTITIDHGNGIFTRMLHQHGTNVRVGDHVKGGQQIGTSGFANAAHTHFEMWRGQPGGKGSALLNPRALFGWDKNNLPQGGREVTGRGAAPVSGAVRGSTFDDIVTASGAPRSQPGIALPSRDTLGQWFKVTTPDGRTIMAQQTDVGPAKWTGRGIDINAPLARQMGYDTKNFPTDQIFKYESARGPLDKALRGMGGDLGGAHITVDFSGVPKDVKTNAELIDEGVFKSLKLNRSTSQAGMAGQNTAPQNNWVPGE